MRLWGTYSRSGSSDRHSAGLARQTRRAFQSTPAKPSEVWLGGSVKSRRGRTAAGSVSLRESRSANLAGKAKHATKLASAKTRRRVFYRDGNQCVLCGIGAGEPYPDQPQRRARLTLGHFVADSLRGGAGPQNLRTECSRCNEPLRQEAQRGESSAEILPKIRSLGRPEKVRLLTWMNNGYRERDEVDQLFDQARILPAAQRDEIRATLERSLRKGPQR